MTITILITFCSLLLLAYVFNITSPRTKIPSVIMLLLLGWLLKLFTEWFEVSVPDITQGLPVLATIGLILIVLEGSLELEMNKSKLGLVKTSFVSALIPILVLAFGLGFLFQTIGGGSFKESFINAIPFCIISSAIAIPSVTNIASSDKEFVIYESSLSDIIGVLLFNFVVFNSQIDVSSFGNFLFQLIFIVIISLIATVGLSLLLHRIEHHIKFVPIILLIILTYAVLKFFHLPALIFILLFGLSIGNLDEIQRFQWISRFKMAELKEEVVKFKELTIEATFLVRALFFIIFGFSIETSELLNAGTILWSILIVASIFILRIIQLKLFKMPVRPLLFIAPRGLITILLFYSIAPVNRIPLVNQSMIIQVIILTVLVMMFGLLTNKDEEGQKNELEIKPD